jgi:hypothetical protein
MNGNYGKSPEEWRNWNTKVPIPAYRLRRGDLKRVYKILNDKQLEIRERTLPILAIMPNETEEQFRVRKKRVSDAFVVSMTVHGAGGELSHGNNEAFLDENNLPYEINSILFNTSSVHQAVLNLLPLCRIMMFLDFTRQPLVDLTRLPTLATPNESNFEITADNESWFTAVNTRLTQFFSEKRTNTNWLHRAGVYDLFLLFGGVPFALWAAYRASLLIDPRYKFPSIITAAIYVYTFIIALTVVRILFSYSRWVFPKAELESDRSSPLLHRGAWLAIIVPILTGFLYDVLKFIFTG